MDACHQNTDIGEGRPIDGLFYIATDTNMNLENHKIVKTKDISLTMSIIRLKLIKEMFVNQSKKGNYPLK